MLPPPEPSWPAAAELPVALLAWVAAGVHAGAVLARRGPFGALDTLALTLVLALPWRLARDAAGPARRGAAGDAGGPYRGGG